VPGAFFEELGFRYFGPIDGHNLALVIQALKNISLINEPILLHLITKKGKGYKFAESDPVKFHSAAPFDVETGISKKSQSAIPDFTETFGRTVCELASHDKRIVVITPAMTAGSGLTEFAKAFPARFFDVGIAEQHALTFAGGLARGGLKPVVAIYSTFLQRAYDQMVHDICLQNLDVVFAIDRAGLVGEDGPTHHGVFDIAYLGHIPNLVLMAPKDEQELKDMIYTAVSLPGPVAIRYPKTGTGRIQADKDYHNIQLGQAEVLKQGRGPVIMAIGSMVYPALKAAEILAKEGIEPTVVNARFVRPLDETLLDELLADGNRVLVTVEEHVERCGFGSIVLDFLTKKGKKDIKIKRLALPNSFIEQGPRGFLLDKYGLSAKGIADSVREVT
jgi:1-deoxy-D-xylulose-5-phosphate synthase